MKAEQLFDLMSAVKDDYIASAAERGNEKKRMTGYLKVGVTAAACLLIAVGAVLGGKLLVGQGETFPESDATSVRDPAGADDGGFVIENDVLLSYCGTDTAVVTPFDNGMDCTEEAIQSADTTVAGSDNEITYKEIQTVGRKADYVSIDLKEIFADADVVVCVKYPRETETYISNGDLPTTESEFEVIDIIKGNVPGNKIRFSYYGGTVSLYEYISQMTEEEKKKGFDKYSEEEARQIGVTYVNEESGVSFEPDKEYFVCLGFDKVSQRYFVMAEANGMSEIIDGRVYNHRSNEWLPIESIKE